MKRESLPNVGIIRYRHFGLNVLLRRSTDERTAHERADEQITVCERDSVAGLHELTEKDRAALVLFYVEHRRLGHDPTPSVVGPLPQ